MAPWWFDAPWRRGKLFFDRLREYPEQEQALLRIVLCPVAIALYGSFAYRYHVPETRDTLIILIAYAVYGFATFIDGVRRPERTSYRVFVTTAMDQAFVAVALFLGDREALPFIFVIFWFLIGAACRYGKGPLLVSALVILCGLLGLIVLAPWWISNKPAGVGLMLGVVATSSYLCVLVSRIERRARTDVLTGLFNRSTLDEEIERTCARLKVNGGWNAILMIDLDGFKDVNDLLGHSAGDELLRQFARGLQQLAKRQDLVARLGGDEFVILSRAGQTPEDARSLADAIHELIGRIRCEYEYSMQVSASIGICLLSATTSLGDGGVRSLMTLTDRAMYLAKQRGKNGTAFVHELPIP